MATAAEERPSSSTSSFSQKEVDKLMSQGKRHFVCNEIVEAVKCFQEACRMIGEKYGQTANECGDAYLQYGKSLLELARVENGVLGNALKEVPIEECDSDEETKMNTVGPKIKDIPEEEKQALKESVQTAMEEKESTDKEEGEGRAQAEGEDAGEGSGANDVATEQSTKETTEEVSEEKEAEQSEEKVEKDSGENKEPADTNGGDGSKGADEEKKTEDEDIAGDEGGDDNNEKKDKENDVEDEADTNNLLNFKSTKPAYTAPPIRTTADGDAIPTIQLAWEMLELARIIFKRNNIEESQLKLAQAHLLLGEINMEQEQFADAITELTKCLNIQKTFLKPDDRLLAETYYNLGLACNLSMSFEESATHYGSACEVLELRIKNIKERIEKEEEQDKGKGKASDDDPHVKDRKELAELEELLPEVKGKRLDARNENEKLRKDIKEQLGMTSVGFGCCSSSSGACTSAAQPIEVRKADDISHLVRRTKQRKPEDEGETEKNNDLPQKKSRQDEDNTTGNVENGDSVASEPNTMDQK